MIQHSVWSNHKVAGSIEKAALDLLPHLHAVPQSRFWFKLCRVGGQREMTFVPGRDRGMAGRGRGDRGRGRGDRGRGDRGGGRGDRYGFLLEVP